MDPRKQRNQKHPTAKSRQAGFSLIELMVVVAIIGILGMIALPQYQTFAAKSKLAAAFAEIAGGKIGIEAIFAEGSSISSISARDVGLFEQSSRCDMITVNTSSLGDVSLDCRLRSDARYGTGSISLTRNEAGTWTCSGELSAERELLPLACQ